MNWFDNLCHGIKNCKLFFSVVWSFRPWDAYYNLSLLKRSLELTKPHMEGYEGCEKAQRQIQSCIDCIERLVADDYIQKEWAELEQKYGELAIEKGKTFDDGCVEVKVIRKGGTEQITDEELGKLERQCWELENHRRNQDIETLFNTLKKFRSWWS